MEGLIKMGARLVYNQNLNQGTVMFCEISEGEIHESRAATQLILTETGCQTYCPPSSYNKVNFESVLFGILTTSGITSLGTILAKQNETLALPAATEELHLPRQAHL